MTKLAQQFNKAGIKGAVKKGWTYPAQREYVPNRFNKLKGEPCAIINHKIEQVARAIVADTPLEAIYTGGAYHASIHLNYPPANLVVIGQVKKGKASLRPDSNSALALLGLNGAAVLYWIGAARIVDELTGKKTEVIVRDDEGILYTSIGVILQIARDLVFKKDAVLAAYRADKQIQGRK